MSDQVGGREGRKERKGDGEREGQKKSKGE